MWNHNGKPTLHIFIHPACSEEYFQAAQGVVGNYEQLLGKVHFIRHLYL